MTWTQNSTTRAWVKTGATREMVMASSVFPGKSGVRLQLTDPTHHVRVVVLASEDGNTCYECGVNDAGTHVVVQQVVFNGAATVLTNGASDDPAGGNAEVLLATCGLTAGEPYILEVRLFDRSLEVYINGTRRILHTILDTEYSVVFVPMANHRHYGFMAAVAGAVVQRADVGPLVDAEPTPQTEILVVVVDGDVFYSEDLVTFKLLSGGGGAFRNSGPVDLTHFNGVVYGVDGIVKRKIDPTTLTVADWAVLTSFHARIVEGHLSRIVLAGDPAEQGNVYFSAAGDPDDFDTGDDTVGHAFALNVALPGAIGQPVTFLGQASGGRLVIGCNRSTWRLEGDPGFGGAEVVPLSLTTGISGKDAGQLVTGGVFIAHSPQGALVIPAGGEAIPLSSGVLHDLIEFPAADAGGYIVQVQRDPARHLVYFFLTPVDELPAVHLVYDEVIGGFAPGAGGFLPDEYADRLGPTASCVFRGRLLLGTRDGHVLEFSDAAADSTDDGEAFTSRMALEVLDSDDNDDDTVLTRVMVTLDEESGAVELRVYGGRTVEEAQAGASRTLLLKRTVSPHATNLVGVCRAPALSVELWNTDEDVAWTLEELQVDARRAEMLTRAGVREANVPDTLPGPPTTTSDSGAGSGGGAGAASLERLLNPAATGAIGILDAGYVSSATNATTAVEANFKALGGTIGGGHIVAF